MNIYESFEDSESEQFLIELEKYEFKFTETTDIDRFNELLNNLVWKLGDEYKAEIEVFRRRFREQRVIWELNRITKECKGEFKKN